MGQLDAMIDQGPHQHCPRVERHDRHPNTDPGTLRGSWCNGIPELEPFIELVVRVPLLGHMSMEPATHEEAVMCIAEEGLPAYVFDEMNSPNTTAVLRVRWGGEDRYYQIREGQLQIPEKP